jgi:hypothetical protein
MRSDGACANLDWAVAAQAIPGEQEPGDRAIVTGWPGRTAIAVIDGLGHGPNAAAAAAVAVETIAGIGAPGRVDEVYHACHRALRATRGVAMSLALIDAATSRLEWTGVGNVEGMLLRIDTSARRRESIVLSGGIVGYMLPTLHVSRHELSPGDLLVFATDGVRPSFADDLPTAQTPEEIANDLLARHARGTDDALVLVARFLGEAP